MPTVTGFSPPTPSSTAGRNEPCLPSSKLATRWRRQFNALAATVQGKIASVRKRRPGLIQHLAQRIARAKDVLATIPAGTNQHHQKRRWLVSLEQRLRALRADEAAGRVRLCFGSRKLLRQQFSLDASGYASHEAWRQVWRAARSSQVFVLGSKDETAGCQGCVAAVQGDGTITLRLRLPDALARGGKYRVIPGLRFAYGQEAVVAALGRNVSPDTREHEAISWRFVRDRKGWRVFATVSVRPGDRSSTDDDGAIGVDLNANHVAMSELDRFGNPVASGCVPCRTAGRSNAQRLAAIGEAIKQVVTYARDRAKPIVVERLDFEKKKAALEQRGSRYARMLSGFAYAAFHAILAARTYDAGVALRSVNPAYTSVIGQYKFARRYGLSVHQAAACSIGRRGTRLAERPKAPTLTFTSCGSNEKSRTSIVVASCARLRAEPIARRTAPARTRRTTVRIGPLCYGVTMSHPRISRWTAQKYATVPGLVTVKKYRP